ncbi:hypothetical protein TELCIR_07860 [Teladorsagia circumcincta]|uniref:Uncharacterized protein n=1 Tax=Teladorsagia circumcincta TaxID=45464 RepID=A0A2G9UKN0_TELCI|nr:hypothetical protein TELCIR_07860 [Teladorsagia circumcincta]
MDIFAQALEAQSENMGSDLNQEELIQSKLRKKNDVTYTIEPIEGRAAIQRNFVKLPERAPNYSNRHVTLNERFSIIERGYYLKPTELRQGSRPPRVVLVPTSTTSPEDIMAASLAKMEKRQQDAERKLAKSQETSPCASPPRSIDSVSP